MFQRGFRHADDKYRLHVDAVGGMLRAIMTVAEMFGVVVIALLGSGHCIGMCTPFSLAVSAGAKRPGTLIARQFVYQLGKATAYVFIGVLILLASDWGGEMLGSLEKMRTVLAWLAGGAMILTGFAYAVEWRWPVRWFAGQGGRGAKLCGAAGELWRSPSLVRALLIGWVNGFLPCGLSLTALIYLASFGSVAGVAVGAYVFGFSTMPALLLAAFFGKKLAPSGRRWAMRIGGVVLIGFGVLTLVRGDASVHHWFHQNLIIDGGPMAEPAGNGAHSGH